MSEEQPTTYELLTDWEKFSRWYQSLPFVKDDRERDEAARREIAARRAEDRWFSVEECLPPEGFFVLTFQAESWDPDQQAEIGYCKNGIWYHAMCDVEQRTDHWRPLPTGPQDPWISTSERLPPPSVFVRAKWCRYRDEPLETVAYRHPQGLPFECWYEKGGVERIPPDYWMPLPDRPETIK